MIIQDGHGQTPAQTINQVSRKINLKKSDLQKLTGEQKTKLNNSLTGLEKSLKNYKQNNFKSDSNTNPRVMDMSFLQSEKAGPLDWRNYDKETKNSEHLPEMYNSLAQNAQKELEYTAQREERERNEQIQAQAEQSSQNANLGGNLAINRNKLDKLSGKDQTRVIGNAISETYQNAGNNIINLRLQEREKLKIEQKQKDVDQIKKEISDLNTQLNKSLYNEDGRVIPLTFISGRKAAINRNIGIQIGEKTAILQSLNGDLQRAENTLKETMATHKEAMSYKTNSMNILFDMAKTKATAEEKIALEKRQRQFQKEQAAASRAHAVRMKRMQFAMSQGWGYQDTMDVLNGKKSGSVVAAKYKAEKKEYSDDLLNAAAAQYKRDGSINSNIYKQLQSQGYNLADIQNIAKKNNSQGSIVDRYTGGKSNISSETIKRINGMQFIKQQLEKLREISDKVEKNRGGFTSLYTGSKIKAEYNKIYDNVVDKLARLRTGAALTKSEEDYYKEILPGFHTTNHLYGASRSDLLNTMIDTFNDDITNNLNSNNAVLVGYNDDITLGSKQNNLLNQIDGRNNQGVQFEI